MEERWTLDRKMRGSSCCKKRIDRKKQEQRGRMKKEKKSRKEYTDFKSKGIVTLLLTNFCMPFTLFENKILMIMDTNKP